LRQEEDRVVEVKKGLARTGAHAGKWSNRIIALFCALLVACTPSAAFAGGAVNSTGDGDEPGKVFSVVPMSLSTTLANVATGKRITYASRDSNNQPIVVSGAVLTPKSSYLKSNPKGANKIVAWAHGTAGIADQCAPSTQPNLYPDPAYNNYADTVASYLTHGWTVTATDYPGLGTPGPHPYLVGDSEGRAVIDSVRAARNLNGSLSNVWIVAGHSQGGQAALFAGEIADTYGMGLQLKGVVAIAPISNLDIIAPSIPGTPAQGYLAFAIYGLAAVDPTVHPEEILAQPALDLAGTLDTGCFNEVMAAYAPLTADEMLIGGVLPDSLIAKAARNNPAQQPNNAPVFLVQGTADLTVPAELTQLLLQEECAVNTFATQLALYPGQDHDPVLYASQTDVVSYLTARFANQPAPSSCP
jgi:pimeloyl-ACP methyl ester carboxylesterase